MQRTAHNTLFRTVILLCGWVGLWQSWFSSGLWPQQVAAQSCAPIIRNLSQAVADCEEINDNWVCYAHEAAQTEPEPYRFYATRDRRPLPVLQSIQTLDKNGFILMTLLLEGSTEPVKIAVMGKAVLEPDGRARNMFTFSAGEGEYLCEATPPGLIVQTAERDYTSVTINGVDIELASTAYITIQADGLMLIANVEGQVTVTINGVSQVLAVGQQAEVTFASGGPAFANSAPGTSPIYASPVTQWLAQTGLPRVHNSNTTAQACVGELHLGETITAQNFVPGQECLYRFCANAGDIVTVEMDALDPILDPWLDLRGPGGHLIGFNDDVDRADLNSLVCNRALPLTSCDYTIVARSTRNASAGPFSLTLNEQTDCVQPELRCSVVASAGVNLRSGPGPEFDPIGNLPAQTQLHPLERTADGAWALVEVLDTAGQQGWVNQALGAIECEDDGGLMPATESLSAATRSPQGGAESDSRDSDKCEKCSPFGAP